MIRAVLPFTPLLGERARPEGVSHKGIVAQRPAAGNRAPRDNDSQLADRAPAIQGSAIGGANGIRPSNSIMRAPAVLSPPIAYIEPLCYHMK